MQNALTVLGWKVRDKVTGFEGIATHVGLDLSGCVQAIVRPQVVKDKDTGAQKQPDGEWFDVSRLERVGESRVFDPIPQKGTELTAGCDSRKPLK